MSARRKISVFDLFIASVRSTPQAIWPESVAGGEPDGRGVAAIRAQSADAHLCRLSNAKKPLASPHYDAPTPLALSAFDTGYAHFDDMDTGSDRSSRWPSRDESGTDRTSGRRRAWHLATLRRPKAAVQ